MVPFFDSGIMALEHVLGKMYHVGRQLHRKKKMLIPNGTQVLAADWVSLVKYSCIKALQVQYSDNNQSALLIC